MGDFDDKLFNSQFNDGKLFNIPVSLDIQTSQAYKYAIKDTSEEFRKIRQELEIANSKNDNLITQNDELIKQNAELSKQIKALTPSLKSKIVKRIFFAIFQITLVVLSVYLTTNLPNLLASFQR